MIKAVLTVCRRQHIPLYSSKYSRKDFTLWQFIALLVLMQRTRKSYREFVDDFLTVTEKIVSTLGLSKLPHYTSLDKFALRVSSILLERVMGGFLYLVRARKQVFGADSSGFAPNHVSYYYSLRIKRDILRSMRKQANAKR